MKKTTFFVGIILSVLCALCALPACSKQVNYSDYISESRSDVFLYRDDATEIKIQCSKKEQPFCADGYKGEMCDLVEIYVTLAKNPQVLEVQVENLGGEMNYQAVTRQYYLSLSAAAFNKSGVEVTLTADEKTETYTALSVKDDNVMSCEKAVECVAEYASELFEGLTSNGLFDGEIFVRLLYDEGCYYYVGVCNKEKLVTAFLIDGERGKVIAKKEIQG
ncbi:MAG: hypothetical protein K2O28_01435 [Clostridia bacterium]|nr:hypothetical protein [Clostridia bacterium]